MQPRFGLRQFLILILLAVFILLPRPLLGACHLATARQLFAAGDAAAAASAFASASARLPWDASIYSQAGQAFWASGDAQQAVHWFSLAEARGTLSLEDWVAYGDAFTALGDAASALHAWQQGLVIHGPNFAVLSRLGLAYRQAGDLPAAAGTLRQAVLLDPSHAGSHYQLGLILAVTDPAAALPYLLQAAALQPDLEPSVQFLRAELNTAFLVADPAYQFTRCGRAVASLGQWDLAAAAFRRAVGEDPDYAEAWAWLGEARQQVGEDGRTQLDRALSLAADSASIQALDGLYWMRQGQPEEALASFGKAASLEPLNPAWQVALGDAVSASSDLLAASIHYRNAVILGPQDASTWRALALFSLDNDTDVSNTGLLAARNLLRLAPGEWLTYDIAGRTALRLGARDEAFAQLLKSIELAPQEPAPHFHLALAYLEFGQVALAYDKLVDTLALDSEGQYGWQANRLLEEYFP